MEALGEHKARHGSRDGQRQPAGEMVQEAQSTLRSLQTERELAERIERGIKQLRAKTTGEDKKRRRRSYQSCEGLRKPAG